MKIFKLIENKISFKIIFIIIIKLKIFFKILFKMNACIVNILLFIHQYKILY
jgi:hypothetical protein